jgi:hypothetical protein
VTSPQTAQTLSVADSQRMLRLHRALGEVYPPRVTTKEERIAQTREWLFRSAALGEASAAELNPRQKAEVGSALSAMAIADQALESPPDDSSGSSAAALSLYREAAYWALAARNREEPDGKASLSDRFAALSADEAQTFASGEEDLALIKDVLVGQTFVETALLDDVQVRAAALAAQRFVRALIASASAPDKRLQRVRIERWARPILAALAPLAVIYALVASWRYVHRPPDLAAGRPWRASSAAEGFPPAGRVGTRPKSGYEMMFHTNNDPSPWVEIDLERPTSVHRVAVTNRPDCCQDRAVPLIVELSDDAQNWVEVDRRPTEFKEWTASFNKRTARYVRLRVAKAGPLHLANVSVY